MLGHGDKSPLRQQLEEYINKVYYKRLNLKEPLEIASFIEILDGGLLGIRAEMGFKSLRIPFSPKKLEEAIGIRPEITVDSANSTVTMSIGYGGNTYVIKTLVGWPDDAEHILESIGQGKAIFPTTVGIEGRGEVAL